MLKKIFYCLGIFSTTSAIVVGFGSNNMTIFNVLILLLWFILLFHHRRKFIINYGSKIFPFMIIAVLAIVVNFGTYNSEWLKFNLVKTLTFSILYCSISFLFTKEEKVIYSVPFFKGLYISTILQLIWETFQFLLWKTASLSLNQIIFGDVLGLQGGRQWTILNGGSLRLTGLSYEPANLAISLVIGYILSSNIYMKILFVVGILLSSSRMGMIVIAVTIILDLNMKKVTIKKIWYTKIRKYKMLICIIFLLVLSVVIIGNQAIIQSIIESGKNTFDSIIGFNNTASGATHSYYYTSLYELIKLSDVKNIVFGYGFGASGYPFSEYLNIYPDLNGWNVESDIIRIFWGTGIIGFIFFYKWIYSIIINEQTYYKMKLIVVAITIGGIFYGYISTWVIIVEILAIYVPKSYFESSEISSVKNKSLKIIKTNF